MKSLKFTIFSVPTLKGGLFSLAISLSACLHGQTIKDFKINQLSQIDSTVISLSSKKKISILALAPSINYNFKNGFSVGFSFSNFLTYSQTKKRNKIELLKFENQLIEKLDNKMEKAELEKEKIFNLKDELLLNVNVLKYRYELYKIAYLKHLNNEATFSEFTKEKITYLEKYNLVISKLNKLKISLIRYNSNYNVILFETKNILEKTVIYEIAN